MCGIVGIASREGIGGTGWLARARDTMVHRGPDDAGIFLSPDGRVGLAHRRLAILDLSSAGHQPMHDSTELLTIVFNGEIYNYKELKSELTNKGYVFRSKSDTEVLLAAYQEWGIECLAKLNGMFAFALYDARRGSIFLARDRAGEKPLFYSITKGEFRFASELKALLIDDPQRRINLPALNLYLSIGYIPGSACIIDGAAKLPPAHAMLFDIETGERRTWRYWNLPEPPKLQRQPSEALTQSLLFDLESLLEDSVRRQLVADVPVGVLLSGGVDSSLITAVASRISNRVKTFTVGFPGFSSYDETDHARLIATHFSTEHVELEAGQITPDLLENLANFYDEPINDSSMVPTFLVSQVVRRHCTVALGGDGGDELFGGYINYSKLLWTHKYFHQVPSLFRHVVANCSKSFLPAGFRGRHWLRSLAFDTSTELPLIASYFDASERRRLLPQIEAESGTSAEVVLAQSIPAEADLLQRATRNDFMHYMPEDILVKVDRASMANSLEIRAPFLDQHIVEFAFGKVPATLKATSTERKKLLKLLTHRLLPEEFDRKRKQGFGIPRSNWLKQGPWRDYFRQVLFDDGCYFDRKELASLFEGEDKWGTNSGRLFGLVFFEIWRRRYAVN